MKTNNMLHGKGKAPSDPIAVQQIVNETVPARL